VPELHQTLQEMERAGIDNVLALRGDPPAGEQAWTKTEGGLEYSRELVELITADYPFAIGAACFPETHIHADSPEADLAHLAEKVAAGVDFLITQLFFDNSRYFDFLARARRAGIQAPIIPGIMPITHAGQVERMAKMCGSSIPEGLRRELHVRADHPEAMLDFGVAYATLQCAELLAAGAPGIHFYTLNRSPATRAIVSALKLTKPWERAIYPASISSPSASLGEPSAAS
jgi:methylenetetrahydrofolate reductase (NADPH)